MKSLQSSQLGIKAEGRAEGNTFLSVSQKRQKLLSQVSGGLPTPQETASLALLFMGFRDWGYSLGGCGPHLINSGFHCLF